MRSTAAVCLRSSPHYQREAFATGFGRAGYRVQAEPAPAPRPGDVLLIWNRQPSFQAAADRYEAAGATVVVTENGYLGSEQKPPTVFALAKGQHNGAGRWRIGETERFDLFRVEVKPWRSTGSHLLVLDQRGFGPPGVAMPKGWAADAARRLREVTDRPIRIRPHPGKDRHQVPLGPDLVDCWAVVTWGSGAALKALCEGIPVFHEFDRWIGAPAATLGIADVEAPKLGHRRPMLHGLSWAQWTLAEIESGEAFEWLLQ
jgi:hypothetical protein